mmetsp:Transcript_3786/g.11791  ORF Transcript_3786/g.11791 Transcript_3786/m.11791 type:complete len:205 (+) Transcript_3786:279-893(+)
MAQHMNAQQLAAHITDVYMVKLGIQSSMIVGRSRDSCSTNSAASRRLAVTFANSVDVLCICHTLCHVGERFQLPTLEEFMTPWLELVGGHGAHHSAKQLWKETVAPATVPGYSNVHWYAKAEIIFVIAEAGTRRLRDFLQECERRDYGDATRRKMISIYENKGTMLRLEIAGMLDMRKLVSTTYEIEGDRLDILLVFDRLHMPS